MFSYLLHIGSFFKLQNFGLLTLMMTGLHCLGNCSLQLCRRLALVGFLLFFGGEACYFGLWGFQPKVFTMIYMLAGLGIILNFVKIFYEHRDGAMDKLSKNSNGETQT